MAALIALGCLTLPGCVSVQHDIVGQASVVDGDSLEIHGERIRLFGIDAPEARQACTRDGRPWRCGQTAAQRLDALIGGRTVRCEPHEIDLYERVVAICYDGEVDLNGALVAEGLALAYRDFSWRYVADEEAARSAGRGVWADGVQFDPPWEWRRRGRQ
ncbi:thermonuclease family protein [Aquimonas sp.]|uniref:thermonuclease family protein n=1 Tax=Aquimonas sp. TaxID=1872588 RepID=UPI0037BE70B9